MEVIRAFNSNNLHTEIVIKGTYEKPLFRASDIGNILEISSIRSVSRDYDDTEKVVRTTHTQGGNQDVTFFTAKGLYKLLFRSKKPIAEKFQNWVCDVIEEIRLTGKYQLEKELEEKNKELDEKNKEIDEKNKEIIEKNKELEEKDKEIEEIEKLKLLDGKCYIYIFNKDPLIKDKPELKIGVTTNVLTRFKPYKQTNTRGKIELLLEIPNVNLKTIENYIHTLLSFSRVQNEVFRIELEEAKLVMLNVVNMLNITQISNEGERQLRLKKLYENECLDIKISTREISTQTDFDENDKQTTPLLFYDNEITAKFNEYIEKMCIVREDVEVSSKDIIGQYRLWSRLPSKETFHALKHYLDTRFKPCRLQNQIKNQMVHGYKGVTLKEIIYKKSLTPSDEETFLFQVCKFSPDSTLLHTTLWNEYKKWKNSIGKTIAENDEISLRKYMKSNEYVLFTTVWTKEGCGQGYYGISLKNDDNYKKTSSTGKKVEKREVETNQIIGTWETIAKAADYEKISSTKMSHSIKNNKIFNNDYYYCLSK
jgi:prophage antirepressor-like protein